MERRPNDKPAEAPSKATTSEAPAPTLEQHIANALIGDLPSVELAELLNANDAAIIAAEQAAQAVKEFAYDPTLSHDIVEARERLENTALLVGRLKTLQRHLQKRLAQVVKSEEAISWLAERDEFEAAHLAAMPEQRYAYDAALQQSSTSSRMSLRSRPLAARCSPVVRCISAWKTSPTRHRLRACCRTRACSISPVVSSGPIRSKQIALRSRWQKCLRASGGDPEQFSPFWWRAAQRRQAAHRVETERQDARLRQLAAEQEARLNKEERERFAAAHGGAVK
jgi:hypothetical protein